MTGKYVRVVVDAGFTDAKTAELALAAMRRSLPPGPVELNVQVPRRHHPDPPHLVLLMVHRGDRG